MCGASYESLLFFFCHVQAYLCHSNPDAALCQELKNSQQKAFEQAKIEAPSKIAIVETKKILQRLHVTGAQDKDEKRREAALFARLVCMRGLAHLVE